MSHALRGVVLASSLVAALVAQPAISSAHVPGVTLSAFGIALVDGTQAPGEWDAAAHVDFQINLPAGGTTPATIYEMNDATTLYLAVVVPGTYIGRGSMTFEFDNDHDGVREGGDDIALLSGSEAGTFEGLLDGYRDPCGNSTPACGFADTQNGGTSDLQAALTSDASRTVYEYAIPLDSADDAHDFSLRSGDTVGFSIWATFLGPYPLFAHTFFPATSSNNAAEYGDIVIASADSTPPIVAAMVSPAANVDGWNNGIVTVTWTATDAESGVSAATGCGPTTLTSDTAGTTLTCIATNGAGQASSACAAADAPAYTFPLGTNTLTASAMDRARNSTTASTSFSVVVTYGSLCNLTRSFETKSQMATTMCGFLERAQSAEGSDHGAAKAASLQTYTNLVHAQAGKTLTAEHAAILERLVTGL